MSNHIHLCLASAIALVAAAPASAALDLGSYSVSLQRGIDFDEASGVAYNYDRNTLFVIDDEGDDAAEYTLGGQRLTADRFGAQYRDLEGVTYVGNGQYVLANERTEQLVKIGVTGTGTFNGVTRNTYTAPLDAPTYNINGGTNIGNNGLEGVSFDPITGGYFGVRQGGGGGVTQAVYLSTVNFGPPTTGSTVQPFDPASLGLVTLSDIAALSLNPNFAGTDFYSNLLILSADSRRLLEVSRTGALLSSFDLSSLAIGVIEGVTLDRAGNIYLVGETGGVSPSFGNPGGTSTSGLIVLSRTAVPEPASWAMMIGGFGLIGGAMRRRGVVGALVTA